MSDRGRQEGNAVALSDLSDPQATIILFLRTALEKGVFDAILVPMRVPAGDGFAYILVKDPALLDDAWPMPPVIGAQGAKAASALTRLGRGNQRVCVVARPCEIRAIIELTKLKQVDLGNLALLSMDCVGALPLRDFSKNPQVEIAKFKSMSKNQSDGIRPICAICTSTSDAYGDLHVGLSGRADGKVPLFASSEKGRAVIDKLGLTLTANTSAWNEAAQRINQERAAAREDWHRNLTPRVEGADNLLDVLSACINCHNCMRACPVCYCRQCYFDSERIKHPADDYFDQAKRKGSLRFLPDMLLFHLGRMTHMSLTCISCGACEDACPASIPIAQIFSFVAERTQKAFDYFPGRNVSDPLPLVVYKEEELEEDSVD